MTLMIDLKEEEEKLLNSQAKADGVSAEQYAQKLLKQALTADSAPLLSSDLQAGSDDRPIWEIFADNMKDVPLEEFEKLPKDGASQVDHYLYGHPKR